ncbi:MAG: sulfurtransferase-like selenium metabolism protein YedF [candidate division Zixibacteria bacterium]|nr:sulfurtransferase-like selenium metabolism protein YedF [candidate division Zixibacteria bacterium]
MAIDKDFMIVIKSSGLGEGEIDLGEKLIRGFLTVLADSETIPARIAFLNSGVYLTTEGSPVAEELTHLADRGTEILSCGTCLDYFGRKDRLIVGNPTDMKATVSGIVSFSRVVTL